MKVLGKDNNGNKATETIIQKWKAVPDDKKRMAVTVEIMQNHSLDNN